MEDEFKIFVDRLQDGEEELIDEQLSPEFLDIHEAELHFHEPVKVQGEALISKGTLVLHLTMSTEAMIPCAICNENVRIPIHITHFYHSEELENIKSGVYNIKDLLREAILIEVPYTTECHGGSCPERKTLAKYLKKHTTESQESHPFADL